MINDYLHIILLVPIVLILIFINKKTLTSNKGEFHQYYTEVRNVPLIGGLILFFFVLFLFIFKLINFGFFFIYFFFFYTWNICRY